MTRRALLSSSVLLPRTALAALLLVMTRGARAAKAPDRRVLSASPEKRRGTIRMLKMLLERVDLGERGRRFIEEWLEAGQTLGQLLQRAMATRAGRVYAFLPSPSERFSAHDLAYGGLFPSTRPSDSQVEPVRNLDLALARLTFKHLAAEPMNCAIFENLLAGATDGYLKGSPMPPLIVAEEVYFSLGPGQVAEDRVRLAIDEARTASGYLGCLSTLKEDEQALKGIARLQTMAKRATAVVGTAFDGEGFAIWSASASWIPERLEL
jgi:hypothetical protein